MIQLASYNSCTGCGACAFVCNKTAISLNANDIGVIVPSIDVGKCVECGRCQKVCPAIEAPKFHAPRHAYAAWHNSTKERVSSASGAIASAAYHFALDSGWDIAGAVQNDDFSVDVVVSDKVEDIARFKNSKYVFSSITKLLPRLAENIRNNKKTLVIALPCQIAAIRKAFPDQEKLVLADVVCHGTTPLSYLTQHIHTIEDKEKKKAKRMSFRDPAFNTYTFTFSLYDDNGDCFYAKRTKDGDTYQYAYHRIVSYRENCFHCQYARPERVGDFTLCDYSGLGKHYTFDYNRINCSCILVNTEVGGNFIKSLVENNIITAFERPLEEPVSGNRQLRQPCNKSKARLDFEKLIEKYNGDFEKAIHYVTGKQKKRKPMDKFISFPAKLCSFSKKKYKQIKKKLS